LKEVGYEKNGLVQGADDFSGVATDLEEALVGENSPVVLRTENVSEIIYQGAI